MGHKLLAGEHAILSHLNHIAPHMLRLKDQHNLTEFVLHELCSDRGFQIDKAAYFIDNPDFNCLRGIAGFSRQDEYKTSCSIWENPHEFSSHMGQASFNQKVRGIARESVRKSCTDDAQIVKQMAQELGFSSCNYYSWDMKHDNHAIVLFESPKACDISDVYVKNGMALLSFCPLF
jgi:hypothetical protein